MDSCGSNQRAIDLPYNWGMAIFDEIGGAPAIDAAVESFYKRVMADPSLDGYFDGVDLSRLKGHQRAFIGVALGGPNMYVGRDMSAAHAHLGISDSDFDTVVNHLVATLRELGVPDETVARVGESVAPLRSDIVTATATA